MSRAAYLGWTLFASCVVASVSGGCVSKEFVLKEAEKNQTTLMQEIDRTRTESSKRADELKAAYQADVKATQDAAARDVQALGVKVDALRGDLAKAQQSASVLAARVDALENSLGALDRDVKERNKTLKEEITKALSEQLATMAQGLQAAQKDLAQIKTDVAEMQGKATENRKEILGIKSELEKTTTSLISFQNTLTDWKKVVEILVQRQKMNVEIEKKYLLERINAIEEELNELDKKAPAQPQAAPK